MTAGDFTITTDKTGFPLIQMKEWNFRIGLMPVSKYQFERYLCSGDKSASVFTDEWYRSYLQEYPRAPYDCWGKAPWELFLTGLSQKGIGNFLSFLGKEYRLPTVEERNILVNAADRIAGAHSLIVSEIGQMRCPDKAEYWFNNRLYPLVKRYGGLPEYVTAGNEVCCTGSPWNDFYENLWEPQAVRPLSSSVQKQMGFRVVTPIG